MAVVQYPWQEELAGELHALRERLPNAVLVYGLRGIGTFDCVNAFAKSLLCMEPKSDGTPCGHCKGCTLIASGNHPDIRYIVSEAEAVPRDLPFVPPDNASSDRKNLYREILIHQPRALTDFLNLKSHEGGTRVVVVYPADRIRAEAAASLLKNIEEPPENTVFLLCADEIDRVLPTIRSRCRLIRALPPSREVALEWLKSQKVEDAAEALTLAGGMPLAAFETDARMMLGKADREKILDFLAGGSHSTAADAVSVFSKDASVPAVSRLLSRWAWDLAAAREGAAPHYFPQYADALAEIAATTAAPALYMWINSVRDVRRAADHPLNARVVLEALLLAYLRAVKPAV